MKTSQSLPLPTPISIRYAGRDKLLHTAENGYLCRDHTCPCWQDYDREMEAISQRRADGDQTGTHAPDCRCGWCSAEE